MDIYYRLRALHRAGVCVTLHSFTYGRLAAPELEPYCERVYYYRRDMSPWLLLRRTPFIAASRDNDELLQRLRQDDAPILIEGLHGCEVLRRLREEEAAGQGRHRTIVVRAHNVEQDYYRLLARSERRPLRKAYLALEAWKLCGYERTLTQADAVVAITDADAAAFRGMGCRNVQTIPPFIPPRAKAIQNSEFRIQNSKFKIQESPYVLYHGDLSVPDNEWAVRWLQRNVMRKCDFPFVVAGRNPRLSLCRYLSRFENTELIASPTGDEMASLVAGARCTVLITRQPTGFKMKLIDSLVEGQHCVVNSAMVAGTAVADCCHVADTAEALRVEVERLMQTPFGDVQRQRREEKLSSLFDEEEHVRQLMGLLGLE